MMRISVLGCGRWGSFVAWYLNRIGHDVLLYGRPVSKTFSEFLSNRSNRFLTLPDEIHLSSALDEALSFGEVVAVSVSAQGLHSLMEDLVQHGMNRATPLVLCMKGLEEASGLRLSEVVRSHLGKTSPVAVWVGPGHVQDFISCIPNCMVIDSDDEALQHSLIQSFSSDLIRFYYGSDLIGNEVGAASKNVIGIAAGMLDGMGLTSLKGALIARAPREISNLISAMGGSPLTAYGLAHLGDYAATVFSPYSNNRAYGEAFIKKEPFFKLAEGVSTASALMALSERYGVELPICSGIYRILQRKSDAGTLLYQLFTRPLKQEF